MESTGNFDGPPPMKQPERAEQKSCFPVKKESIDAVNKEIQNNYQGTWKNEKGNWPRFVDAEMATIAKDDHLKDFVDKSFGWYEDFTKKDADKNAFQDGVAYVHRVLREQGTVPLLHKDSSDALTEEIEEYDKIADERNQQLFDVLSSIHTSPFSRLEDLSPNGKDRELGNALRQMTAEHPSKPSFVLGAELTYAVLKKANKQTPDIDKELEGLLGGV